MAVPAASACGQDARAPFQDGSVAVPAASSCGQDARAPFQDGSVAVPAASPCGQDARAPFQEGSVAVPAASACGQDARAPFFNPLIDHDSSVHKLPHWNQTDCYCFVTWRLDDAMPKEKLDLWNDAKQAWLTRNPEPWDVSTEQEYHMRFSSRLEEWLDAGHGSCVLKHPAIRKIVSDAIAHFDTVRYLLISYVIMPNHVHVLLKLKTGYQLAEVMHSWKSFTAKAINHALNRTGTLWQPEYWDRLIRNERHFIAYLCYIRDNPKKAHLRSDAYTVWERDGSVAVPAASACGQDARAPFLDGSVAVPAASPCGQDARAPLNKTSID